MKKILSLAALLCAASISQAVTYISTATTYSSNTTISGDIYILPGGSLTVATGVTLTINASIGE